MSYTTNPHMPKVRRDAVKTATLMLASGVMPDHKNHGSKLRTVLAHVGQPTHALDLYGLVSYYHGEWRSRIDLTRSREATYTVFWQELQRKTNLSLHLLLGVDERPNQSTETLLRMVIRDRKVSMEQLREILRRI